MQRQLGAIQQNTSARSSVIDLVDEHRQEKADRPANRFIAPPFAFQASPAADSYFNYYSRLSTFNYDTSSTVGALLCCIEHNTNSSAIIVGPLFIERSLRGI